MNFFKSVFADESEPESDSEPLASDPTPSDPNRDESGSESDVEDVDNANSSSGWDFGGLMKTLASKSESVLDTYKRDLQEFSSGLKAETAVLSDVASRVVNELPKFDELKTTVLQFVDQEMGDKGEGRFIGRGGSGSGGFNNLNNYSRFEARLRAMEIDRETYVGEVEEEEEYKRWREGFGVLEEKGEEIGRVFEENAAMESLYHKIVPAEVDQETFWYRYFYKVFKMQQAEEVRASFLKKARDEEEEELSWDVDEDEEEESDDEKSKEVGNVEKSESLKENADVGKVEKSEPKKEIVVEEEVKRELGGHGEAAEEDVKIERAVDEEEVEEKEKVGGTESVAKEVEKEGKKAEAEPVGNVESGAKGKSEETVSKGKEGATTDEDLSWDEIEDEGSDGEKPVAPRVSHDKAELQKRLSTAVEDEDLSWDIEDDDEPVKA